MASEEGRKAEGSRTVPNLILFVFGMACTISLQAADPTGIASLPDYERRGIEKLAELTAKDHSTILFTIADETIGFGKDGAVGRIGRDSVGHCNRWTHPALSHDGLRWRTCRTANRMAVSFTIAESPSTT